MNPANRFCKDCIHFADGVSWCEHPQAPRDPVDGSYLSARGLRSPGRWCGTYAQYWEPIE
jgi:hypothetical protein